MAARLALGQSETQEQGKRPRDYSLSLAPVWYQRLLVLIQSRRLVDGRKLLQPALGAVKT